MPEIRKYREGDFDALYRICLETGDAGRDASQLYRDPRIVGHVYAAPYGHFSPETAFVLEDGEGVGGYIIGPVDTYAFERTLEAEWWPDLRALYPDPDEERAGEWSADERLMHHIHYPPHTPKRLTLPYPAHLHIDLLPRFQGLGFGRRMIETWSACVAERGASGFHLGVSARNERAVRFYRKCGLDEIERLGPPYDTYFFGRRF